MEWDTTPGLKISRYEVQRRPFSLILKEDQYRTLDDDVAVTLGGRPTRFSVQGLRPGSKHQLRVRSADAAGLWRPWKTALVSEVLQCACTAPDPPSGPRAALSYAGGEPTAPGLDRPSVALAWQQGGANGHPVEGFEVWRRDGRAAWHLIGAPALTAFVDLTGLALGGVYGYRVRARNKLGWSPFGDASEPVVIFRVMPPLPPTVILEGVSFLKVRPPPTHASMQPPQPR